MTQIEIHKEIIKTGDYGCLVYRTHKGNTVRSFGKIKFIDSDGIILFKDDFKVRIIDSTQIISFNKHDMLPPPTEHKGKKLTFDGGIWIDEDGKEIDIRR